MGGWGGVSREIRDIKERQINNIPPSPPNSILSTPLPAAFNQLTWGQSDNSYQYIAAYAADNSCNLLMIQIQL